MTASGASSASRPRPRLLLSDVDGTLVTTDKVLTQATRQAVARLRAAGIRFAITSSRPPAGLRAVVEALAIDTPIAAFNGGMIVAPGEEGAVLAEYLLPSDVALRTVDLLAAVRHRLLGVHGRAVDGARPGGPYVDHEERTVGFPPTVVDDFRPYLDGVGKIVGVSDDFDLLEHCEGELRQALGETARPSCARSPTTSTSPIRARTRARPCWRWPSIWASRRRAIATIGDGLNDVAMFAQAGLSIAMGNAEPAVKEAADLVIEATNEQDGFAAAVERYILGDGSD